MYQVDNVPRMLMIRSMSIVMEIYSHIIILFSAMAGVASNVCFMALRDLDENKYHMYPANTNIEYLWTFMTSWIATGLLFILAFLYICLLCVDYDDVNESGKYSTFPE